MNKSIFLVIGVGVLLTVGLYSLPNVVVRNEDRKLTNERTTDPATAVRDSAVLRTDRSDLHTASLSPEQQKELNRLSSRFESVDDKQKPVVGQELIQAYRKVSRFDSAARISEQLATLAPTEANVLRTGDLYYEAYGFAVDNQKLADFGKKTRDFYQKALDSNPNLLAAKANMAMTYVTTDTPMKGIMLLRDVLKEDPTNELGLFNMGLLSMRSGQYNRAVERFQAILASHPDNTKAQFYLAISLSEMGRKEEARKLLAKVKEREKDPTIQAAVKELEKNL
ncbi:tetratricopeptide repeat protein [Larkinella terrae]|uniref:Tetratricopeptide repeat protein n=1 Tax=Larkinella terrae TaxID=2025311 RepID=A0A7K0EEB1_9BACT|nr:tetratricopeptide repeat protein [Larkinella terrae]MRS60180.1 tetratricopeptide repeat protein [Larkinella terrae]